MSRNVDSVTTPNWPPPRSAQNRSAFSPALATTVRPSAVTTHIARTLSGVRLFRGCEPGQEWELLAHRQAHQPAGVTRLLEVIIDENALNLPLQRPQAMAGQVRHLPALADSPHATVRVVPKDAVFYDSRGHQFDILTFAGTSDRIGVSYTIRGYQPASGDAPHGLWNQIQATSAADPEHSRAIPKWHLASLS